MALFFQLQHRVAHPYQHQQSPAKYPGRVIARVSALVFQYFCLLFVHWDIARGQEIIVHLCEFQCECNYCPCHFCLFFFPSTAGIRVCSLVVLSLCAVPIDCKSSVGFKVEMEFLII